MKENKEKRMKGGVGKRRSEKERERTKIRERTRRAITTNIFNGLRKHGGYCLSNRSDINAVLRQLANEAGFVVEADGTTYRSKASTKCPLCGSATAKSLPTHNTITTDGSSLVIDGVGNSSTAPMLYTNSVGDSAGQVSVAAANNEDNNNNNLIGCSSPLLGFDGPISVPIYTCQDQVNNLDGGDGFADCCGAMAMGSNVNGSGMTFEEMQREALLLDEAANMVGPMPMSLPLFYD